MNKLINFLKEARLELSKVSWPTRSLTFKYTLVVIGLSLFLAIFLGLLDSLFLYVTQQFILK